MNISTSHGADEKLTNIKMLLPIPGLPETHKQAGLSLPCQFRYSGLLYIQVQVSGSRWRAALYALCLASKPGALSQEIMPCFMLAADARLSRR